MPTVISTAIKLSTWELGTCWKHLLDWDPPEWLLSFCLWHSPKSLVLFLSPEWSWYSPLEICTAGSCTSSLCRYWEVKCGLKVWVQAEILWNSPTLYKWPLWNLDLILPQSFTRVISNVHWERRYLAYQNLMSRCLGRTTSSWLSKEGLN